MTSQLSVYSVERSPTPPSLKLPRALLAYYYLVRAHPGALTPTALTFVAGSELAGMQSLQLPRLHCSTHFHAKLAPRREADIFVVVHVKYYTLLYRLRSTEYSYQRYGRPSSGKQIAGRAVAAG